MQIINFDIIIVKWIIYNKRGGFEAKKENIILPISNTLVDMNYSLQIMYHAKKILIFVMKCNKEDKTRIVMCQMSGLKSSCDIMTHT